jgi:FG-GAP-like repeat
LGLRRSRVEIQEVSDLIINITYDSSVNSAPAAFKTAIAAAVQFLDTTYINPITINIDVGYGEIDGQALSNGALGESETFYNNYTYSNVRTALVQNARSADQVSAANSLPAADPTGGGNYWVSTAEAKALGLMGPSGATDGFVGFSSSFPFTYNDSNGVAAGTYDFNGVALHELTEVMGRDLFVGNDGIGSNSYTPLDLFHYSSQGTRDFSGTTAGYFSPDGGKTNLDNFNTNPNGDFGDWASSAGHDSVLAFSNSGVVNAFSEADIREMNVLGYNEPGTTPARNDFNGDGDSDLLLQNTGNGNVMIDLMNGTTIASSTTFNLAGATNWHVMGTGDFNGDGKADVIWQNTDGTPAIWLMNGTTITSAIDLPNPGAAWHVIGTGDFNKDGMSDVLFQNDNNNVMIDLMNGTTITSSTTFNLGGATNWHVIGTGDFNGDGMADVLWQNTDGTPAIWLMNGTQIASAVNLANPGAAWKLIGTGDFNKDGMSDLLFQNTSNSNVMIDLMNGTTVMSSTTFNLAGATNWHVIGTSDFNGDGMADVLWQNTDGTPAIWLMNGTQITSAVNLANPGATWKLEDDGPAVLNGSGSVATSNGTTNTVASNYVTPLSPSPVLSGPEAYYPAEFFAGAPASGNPLGGGATLASGLAPSGGLGAYGVAGDPLASPSAHNLVTHA